MVGCGGYVVGGEKLKIKLNSAHLKLELGLSLAKKREKEKRGEKVNDYSGTIV